MTSYHSGFKPNPSLNADPSTRGGEVHGGGRRPEPEYPLDVEAIAAWTEQIRQSRRAYHRHMVYVAQQDGRARALDRAIEREAGS